MDREEILELLCSKYVYVIRLMKIMGVDENDVEDVATEVFIDAFRGLDNLRDPEKLVPWLKKIARNRASKYFRKRAKRKEISNMIKTEMGEIDIFDTIADEVTVEKLLQDAERRGKVMAARTEKRKRRHMRELAGVAALFILVVVGGIMVFNTFTTDVDADKNAKEEIVTEDGVVIEDGGWGSSSEDNWVITDWAEVKIAKITVPELVVPEYIPKGYTFESLTIINEQGITNIEYLFNNGADELLIHQYMHEESLEATHIYENDKKINSDKGDIYIQEIPDGNKAIIQLDDGVILEIWSNLIDVEIIKFIENINY